MCNKEKYRQQMTAYKNNFTEDSISSEHKDFLKKVKISKISILAAQILLLAVFFVLWELFARLELIDPFITSQPSRVAKTLTNLYNEGKLFYHIWITCLETVIGFLAGTFFGIIIAVILWWSNFLARVMEPYLVILNSLPKIALGPIFIVWIGAGPSSIIAIALTISLIVTILEVLNGFLAVDQEKTKLVRTFGANRLQVLTKVVLPASFPTMISALKINVGLSWVGVIVGEFLVSKAGLGYLIVYGGQVFQLDLVMASVLVLAAAAALMYQGVVYLEKFLVRNNIHK